MRPAVPRASAYAHVVNATDVGNTPRYAIHAMLDPGAARKSRTRAGAYGRQTSAPIVQHTHVTCSAGSRPSTGFWATTPAAYPNAATRHSRTPDNGAVPDVVARPITTTPANATVPPMTSARESGSRRNTTARATRKIGPTLTSIAAVPASTRRSASLRTTLYRPNHRRPAISSSPTSRRAARVHPRVRSRAPNRMLPSVSRPSARAPGENARPAALMPTNAEAHRQTETRAAPRGSHIRDRASAGVRLGAVTTRTYTEASGARKGAPWRRYEITATYEACRLRQRSSRRASPKRSTYATNAGVGPRHRSSSTSRNSGASVRSVARSLNSSARSRCSPSTEGGKSSIAPYSFTSRAAVTAPIPRMPGRSEEHTSELQSRLHLVCRLLLEKKKKK